MYSILLYIDIVVVPISLLTIFILIFNISYKIGVLEYVFCILGEYGLHLGTILLVATVLTLYTEIPTVGNLTPAAVVAAVTENIAKIEL